MHRNRLVFTRYCVDQSDSIELIAIKSGQIKMVDLSVTYWILNENINSHVKSSSPHIYGLMCPLTNQFLLSLSNLHFLCNENFRIEWVSKFCIEMKSFFKITRRAHIVTCRILLLPSNSRSPCAPTTCRECLSNNKKNANSIAQPEPAYNGFCRLFYGARAAVQCSIQRINHRRPSHNSSIFISLRRARFRWRSYRTFK